MGLVDQVKITSELLGTSWVGSLRSQTHTLSTDSGTVHTHLNWKLLPRRNNGIKDTHWWTWCNQFVQFLRPFVFGVPWLLLVKEPAYVSDDFLD